MLKNILQSLFTKGAVAGINFLVLILSSRYLGVNSRGEISLFILNLSIVQLVCGIYAGNSIVYFIPKFNFKFILRDAVIFTVVFSALSNVIIVSLNKQVQGYEWIGYLVSVLIILNTFNCMVLLGSENIRMFNFLSLLQPALLLIGIAFFILILKVYTFEAYLLPLIISFSISFIYSFVIILRQKNLSEPKIYQPGEIISKGLMLQSGLLMYLFCNRFSYYLLPGSAELGLYSSALTISESVLIVANGVAPVL